MKRKTYLKVLLIFVLLNSCKTDRLEVSNIEYSIIDYKLKDIHLNKIKEGHEKAAEFLKTSSYLLKFTKNDTLFIDPLLGMRYFGDSIFHYKISGDVIELNGKKGKKKIFLNGDRTSKFINVSFENDIFERIGLVQSRVKYKNNRRKLFGKYSVSRVDIGDKYLHDKILGYRIFDSVGKVVFNFKKNDSLYMSPKFGMKYYGDSAFYYHINDQKLILDSKGGRFEIPFKGSDLSRAIILHPTDGNFKFLWITKEMSGITYYKEGMSHKEKIKNKSNLKLKGGYSMPGYSLGEKYRGNSMIGHSKISSDFTGNKILFDFLNDSIVKINSEFGMKYFGDSIFIYEIDGEFIRFRNDKFKKEMNFKKSFGLLDLEINHEELKILQLGSKFKK